MNITNKFLNFLKVIGLLLTLTLICTSCNQSPQERSGISLLPQNRPTARELKPQFGNSIRY
ncbi:MAG: hypothetical protein GY756_27700 [bacterium]|nr:hypothetical protein [bacterium]